MTNERKAELFQGMLEWIYDHTERYGIEEYINALDSCGFTEDEIREDLSNFLDSEEEVNKAFKEYEENY